MSDDDGTASLMTPARLAQLRTQARPASPKAYLDQLAADAGSGHARRLADLRTQIEQQLRGRNLAAIQAALGVARGALQGVDFSALQPRGLLARAMGKGREETAVFASRRRQTAEALDDLREQAVDGQRRDEAMDIGAGLTLAEMATETQAIESIIDQGSRWLHDMRNQLRVRQMQKPDAAAQAAIDEDTRRCELLVARIKLLRAANSTARHAQEICEAAVAQRAGFHRAMLAALDQEGAAWQRITGELAEDPSAASARLDEARRAHEALQMALARCERELTASRDAHANLLEELAVLAAPLAAAA